MAKPAIPGLNVPLEITANKADKNTMIYPIIFKHLNLINLRNNNLILIQFNSPMNSKRTPNHRVAPKLA